VHKSAKDVKLLTDSGKSTGSSDYAINVTAWMTQQITTKILHRGQILTEHFCMFQSICRETCYV